MQFMELERVETGQRRIADFLAVPAVKSEREEVDLEENVQVKVEMDMVDRSKKRVRSLSPALEAKSEVETKAPVDQTEPEIDPEDPAWSCPRCGATFKGDSDFDPDERYLFVLGKKSDHEDYHFALDLQNGNDHYGKSKDKKKTKKRKAAGIASFFKAKV